METVPWLRWCLRLSLLSFSQLVVKNTNVNQYVHVCCTLHRTVSDFSFHRTFPAKIFPKPCTNNSIKSFFFKMQVPHMLNVLIMWLLIYFTFSVIGNNYFSTVKLGNNMKQYTHFHFYSFLFPVIIILFIFLTFLHYFFLFQ